MRAGCDISNYTTLTQYTADYLRGIMDVVCIGLQDSKKARDFKDMLIGDGIKPLEFQYYVDLPGRNMDICFPGEVVWIDIEPGCFQDAQQVRDQGTRNTEQQLVTYIYCNQTSIQPVFGDSTELADWPCPLVYANYSPPLPERFRPFNGWQTWAIWQYSSQGLWVNQGQGGANINCDLLLLQDQAK